VHRRWRPAVAVAVALFVAAVVPAAPGGGGGPVGVDKLFHAVGYATLAGALAVALERRPRSVAAVGAIVGAVACGIGIELVQAGVPYRAFSPVDVAANGIGAVTGVFARAVASRFE